MRIYQVEYHRNGTAGNGFHVIRFDGRRRGGSRNMVATVFEEPGNIAVLSIPLLAENNITFGENSWRCEDFEKEMRAAIVEHQKDRDALNAQVRRDQYRTTYAT